MDFNDKARAAQMVLRKLSAAVRSSEGPNGESIGDLQTELQTCFQAMSQPELSEFARDTDSKLLEVLQHDALAGAEFDLQVAEMA